MPKDIDQFLMWLEKSTLRDYGKAVSGCTNVYKSLGRTIPPELVETVPPLPPNKYRITYPRWGRIENKHSNDPLPRICTASAKDKLELVRRQDLLLLLPPSFSSKIPSRSTTAVLASCMFPHKPCLIFIDRVTRHPLDVNFIEGTR